MSDSTSRLDLFVSFRSARGDTRVNLGRKLLVSELTHLIKQLTNEDDPIHMGEAADGLRALAGLADDCLKDPLNSYVPTPD